MQVLDDALAPRDVVIDNHNVRIGPVFRCGDTHGHGSHQPPFQFTLPVDTQRGWADDENTFDVLSGVDNTDDLDGLSKPHLVSYQCGILLGCVGNPGFLIAVVVQAIWHGNHVV